MQFRWSTKVLTGAWRRSQMSALTDALRAGHAEFHDGEIALHEFVRIEQQAPAPGNRAEALKLAA